MLIAGWLTGTLNTLFCVTGIFMIFLILIQRGKGGGLIGALGGGGGASPFGSRAGDMFTKITLGVAAVWFILAMVQIVIMQPPLAKDRPPDQVNTGKPN